VTTHLSARLAWHDRGWDGRICDQPHLNGSCIVHEHIRDGRDDEREKKASGVLIANLKDWQPPCSRDPGAFSHVGYRIEHRDPLDFRNLPSVTEDLPPYSSCPAPYRWMREDQFRVLRDEEGFDIPGPPEARETGWVYEPVRQVALLGRFWEKLTPRESLIFYYVVRGNPVDEDAARLVVGAGRIKRVSPQLFFGTTAKYREQYPVWSRCVTQDYPTQGVRLPYQEYLRAARDPLPIACKVPAGSLLAFSYGSEHVSDDTAIGIIERLIQSVERVREDGVIDGQWDASLEWLHGVLAEVWTARGSAPGLGNVLRWLGMARGVAFHRTLARQEREGQTSWRYVESLLSGGGHPDDVQFRTDFARAAARWAVLSAARRELLATLSRMELDLSHIKRIADEDVRPNYGITATTQELVENPYLLSEQDQGADDSDPIGLEVVDRAMRPDSVTAFSGGEALAHDDPRRVRAVMTAVLRDAASSGDSVLPLRDTFDRIRARFPERRACIPDRDAVLAHADFYSSAVNLETVTDRPLATLRELFDAEQLVRGTIELRVRRPIDPAPQAVDWGALVDKWLKTDAAPARGADLEARARTEKTTALATLFAQRFSILTGRAGTGKTSVLQVLLEGLDQIEGRKPVLLLAPTGKARVRLATRTNRDACTIHQLLVRYDWLNPETFALKRGGGKQAEGFTIVIDEASMIPIDLFAALLRAVDMNKARRLILVGDPNQLPPIGPGRPFMDILTWLESDPELARCVAKLTERARYEDANSRALRLADGYLRESPPAGDDELLAAVARGESEDDLEVHFWKDQKDLDMRLRERMKDLLPLATDDDYEGFNASLGVRKEEWQNAERWQLLTALRSGGFGTNDLNRSIQGTFKKGLIAKAKRSRPRPFGEEQIVWTDKVIQVVNRRKRTSAGDGLDYVANGEIGIVASTGSSDRGDSLEVAFATQPKAKYRYWAGEVDEQLELAYALTVHKAQGSDFEIVFFVIPEKAATLSRELLYTGLTRFRKKLVLLLQTDVAMLERMRRPEQSQTLLRNSNLFELNLRPEDVTVPFANHLIHRTGRGILVRSKSEVIVADTLTRLGISYDYEVRLPSRDDERDFRLPDFTVHYAGDTYFWEHLGMLDVPSYRESWERKNAWYEKNGYVSALITSRDGPDGGINATEIEQIARKRILGG
jgi:exodeoxyribonuclease V alpha subunit